MSGIDASVVVQAKETDVFARLRDIVVLDVDPKTVHKKVKDQSYLFLAVLQMPSFYAPVIFVWISPGSVNCWRRGVQLQDDLVSWGHWRRKLHWHLQSGWKSYLETWLYPDRLLAQVPYVFIGENIVNALTFHVCAHMLSSVLLCHLKLIPIGKSLIAETTREKNFENQYFFLSVCILSMYFVWTCMSLPLFYFYFYWFFCCSDTFSPLIVFVNCVFLFSGLF